MKRPKPRTIDLPRTVEDFTAAYEMSLADYMEHCWEKVFRQRWGGVEGTARICKCPFDLILYRDIILATKPRVVVEIGTGQGGSTLFFRDALSEVFGTSEGSFVVTVDHRPKRREIASAPGVLFVAGNSRDPKTVATVMDTCRGHRCMVVHDGGHGENVVACDLRNYSALVSPGCYFVVEDTVNDVYHAAGARHGEAAYPRTGTLRAVLDFVGKRDDFEIDYECHRYIFTFAPFGFLRRKK